MAATTKQNVKHETLVPVRSNQLGLVERVTAQLREKIIDGHFEVNSFLPAEAILAERLHVSRTVVREAMRILSAQGLVELSQGRRAMVKPPDPEASIETLSALLQRSDASHRDLIKVRRMLESEIAALAAEHASDEDLRGLEEASDAMKSTRNQEQSVEADLAFHMRLAESSGSPIMTLIMHSLRNLLIESMRRTVGLCSPAVHEPIIDALRGRDPQKAREAILAHLEEKESLLTKSPREGGET